MITANQLHAMLASETSEVFLMCVTLSHPSFAAPYQLVCDMKELARASGTFTPFAFQLNLPNQTDDSPPQVQMAIDNVDNTILLAIKNLPAGVRPDLLLEVVTQGEPDATVVAPVNFKFLSIDYDVSTVNATIGFDDDLLNASVPAATYTPSNSPGLFL